MDRLYRKENGEERTLDLITSNEQVYKKSKCTWSHKTAYIDIVTLHKGILLRGLRNVPDDLHPP